MSPEATAMPRHVRALPRLWWRALLRYCVSALVLALLLLSSRRAQAEETLCAGCRLSLPEGTDKVPLVVALHGDYQPVTTMHEAWRRLAVPRGVAVLSIACPTSLGCKGSFWRWDGAPSFILGEVAKVSARRAIDPERLYLVGWSGGGSYIGWRAQELEQSFAAIVIHGGGMPPSSATCSGQKTPVYFLVGDKNPFHALAKNLRDYWKGCESPVTWDLLKGAEHPEEWNALTGHGRKIMDWLLAQKKAAPPPMTEARQLP